MSDKITIALPKGRIAEELVPILQNVGITPEADYFNEKSRKLQFATNHADISIVRVRSFDVATFVAYGAAELGIVGNDVLEEHDYPDIYSPIDIGIGRCRLSVAVIASLAENKEDLGASHIRIATKYPTLTQRYFARKGIQAECIKLNGAIELAPTLGLCRRIVDLVSTGETLKANGLVETETILDVSSRLIVNRTAYKTKSERLIPLVKQFQESTQEIK